MEQFAQETHQAINTIVDLVKDLRERIETIEVMGVTNNYVDERDSLIDDRVTELLRRNRSKLPNQASLQHCGVSGHTLET